MNRLLTCVAGWVFIAALSVQAAPGIASRVQQQSLAAGGGSFLPHLSDDGRRLVFVSQANNLVSNTASSFALNVYLRDLVSSNTVLVSVATNGLAGANADANSPAVSSNGHFIAFTSRASNLAAGDDNGAQDIFLRDVAGGVTALASVALDGQSPAEPGRGRNVPLSDNPVISADGRFVVFESRATNLAVTPIPDATAQIFRRDIWSNTTALVSVDPAGAPAAKSARLLGIDKNGRFVAFTAATESPDNTAELYVRDLAGGQSHIASALVNSLTNLGAYHCTSALLDDARVWFVAESAVGGALFSFEFSNQQLRLVRPSTRGSVVVSVTDDSQFLLYEEGGRGSMRVDGSTGAGIDLGVTPCGCSALSGTNCAYLAQMSADGRYVAFLTPTACDSAVIKWRDITAGITTTVAETAINERPVLARSGLTVAFASPVSSIVAADLNTGTDIFLHDTAQNVTELISAARSDRPGLTSPRRSGGAPLTVSDDGRYVAFVRFDDPSVFRDTNRFGDGFVADLQSGAIRAVTIDTNLYTSETGGMPFYRENLNPVGAALISGNGSRVIAMAHTFAPNTSRLLRCEPGGATVPLGSQDALGAALSTDGNSIVYSSRSMIHFNDFNNANDVFLTRLDLAGPTNYLVSGTSTGNSGAGESINPVLSRSGRWVVFATRARNLLPGEAGTFSESQIVAADLGTDPSDPAFGYNPPKRLVSYDQYGAPLPHVTNAAVSGNSRYVIFAPTNMSAVYRHDLLSSNSANVVIATNGRNPSVSADGSVVAFERARTDGLADIIVVDASTGIEKVASPGRSNSPANSTSAHPIVSSDGRYVVFQSQASNLVPGDSNGFSDIFVHDRVLGITFLLSATPQGTSGHRPSSHHVLAANGRTVVFRSFAGDLAAGDFNETSDVFAAALGSGDTDGDGLDDDWEVAYFGNLLRDGSGDYDGDGLNDRNEFLAATDPTNAGSVFRVITLTALGGGSKVIFWNGVPSHNYRVEYRDDVEAGAWLELDTVVSWVGSTASAADNAPGKMRFYRVVRLP